MYTLLRPHIRALYVSEDKEKEKEIRIRKLKKKEKKSKVQVYADDNIYT